MASSAMLRYLAVVARDARKDAGRKPYNVASAEPGMVGADPSTVWRFEQGQTWPQDADHMIDLYAADLRIEPLELWHRALELWRSEATGHKPVSQDPAADQPSAAVDGLADRLLAEAESPPQTETDSEQSPPAD